MEVTVPLTARTRAETSATGLSMLSRPRLIGSAVILFVGLNVPFIVYNQLDKILDTASKAWFIYHPVFMSLATIGIPLTAVFQQRLAGYKSNKIHMYMMITAISCAITGFYVIFSNKREKGEKHFESMHGRFGLAWLVIAAVLGTFGIFALDADDRIKFFSPQAGISNFERFKLVRKLHMFVGRAHLLFGFLIVYLGWINFFGPLTNFKNWAAMSLLLLVFSSVALYDPIVDYLGRRKSVIPAASQIHRGG